MQQRSMWVAVALSGGIMVMAGAFGAHGLEGRVSERLLAAFETGVRYQAWHTLAMLAVLTWRQLTPLAGQGWVLGLWAVGIALFSGSLYLMALTGIGGLGAITPIGGVALVSGWLALAVTAWKTKGQSSRSGSA